MRDVLTRPGIGWFSVDEDRGQIDMTSGSTAQLHRADDMHGSPTLVVAVALSKTPRDFALDCSVALEEPPGSLNLPAGALVHSGFAEIAHEVVTGGAIFDKIDWHCSDGKVRHVVWTGHSLGGAVATLLAAAYACRTWAGARAAAVTAIAHVVRGDDSTNTTSAPMASRSRLVTMGAPRVGDEAALAMSKALTNHTCVVAEGDTVPL